MDIPSEILRQSAIRVDGTDEWNSEDNLKPHQPALSLAQQVENLKNLGLVIEDAEKAKSVLNTVSYFRLVKAYGVGLKPHNGVFDGKTSFEDLVALYDFNTEFRQLLISQIERIEITLRCRLANYFSVKYGVLGYKDCANFADEVKHRAFLEEAYNSRSPFVRNFRENYEGRDVPFYALVEILSFGTLSKFFKNMKNSDKKELGLEYGHRWTYLESWFETLAYIRNICAHYGRLYNIRLDKTPKIPVGDKRECSTIRVFWAVYCIKKLVPMDGEWVDFLAKVNKLFLKYPQADKTKMGFPEDWQDILRK